VAPSTHVAHVEVRTATTTSSEASARLQRTIVSILRRWARRVNFLGNLAAIVGPLDPSGRQAALAPELSPSSCC
jgi:hypothetical protein